jgi:hypothetical protein
MAVPEQLDFTLPTVDDMGTVAQTPVADFDRVVGQLTWNGPPGPSPRVSGDRFVVYGGALTNGNYFGSCEVTIAGAFQKRVVEEIVAPAPNYSSTYYPWAGVFGSLAKLFSSPKYREVWVDGSFIATGKLTVNPPSPAVFSPDPITIPKGSPGPHADVVVTVTPAGPYEIVLSIPNLEQRASLFVPTIVQTGADGKATFYIEDLANASRQGMIVKATISSQMPCSAPDVVSTFTVDVA